MGYGLWVMGYGLWVMGYGLWVMGYGLWVMGYGLWVMGKGPLFLFNNFYINCSLNWLILDCCNYINMGNFKL
jgi:hypothetical protein